MDTKTCTRCLADKPTNQFRRRGRNDDRPAAHCHECHRLSVEMWRDRQRLGTVKEFVSAVEKADDIKLVQAAKAVMRAFRGPVGFALAWKAGLESAPPGVRGRMLNAFLLLSSVADRRTYVDKNRLSDEDIDRELAKIMEKYRREAAAGVE